MIVAAFFAGIIFIWVKLIKGTLQRKADREAVRKRVQEARKKILADGKIEGPKGEYHPKRWGRKWIDYAHSLPGPSAKSRYIPQHKELPDYPSKFHD
jgi:hypothetical protein